MDNVLYYQEKGTGQPFILFQKTEEAKRHRISGMIHCMRIVSVILIH